MNGSIWLLALVLGAFTLKHFIADFLLQSDWIARGKDSPRDWPLPLAVHLAIHAGMTLAIVSIAAPHLWWLAPADFAVHGAIDRGKSLISQRGGWNIDDQSFWWLIGADQFLHQITNITLALFVARSLGAI